MDNKRFLEFIILMDILLNIPSMYTCMDVTPLQLKRNLFYASFVQLGAVSACP